MQRIEELIGGCSPVDRVPMLALYQLYNALAPEDGRRPRRHEILGRYGPLMQGCSIAFLSFWPLLAGEPIPWPVAECVAAFEGYQKNRYKAAAIHLPVLFEVAVMAAIANLCLEAGDRDSFAIWVGRAILDAAGRKPIQEMLAGCRSAFRLIDTRSLVGLPPAPEQTEEVASHPAADEEGMEYPPPKVAGQTAPPG
jgi:hypothetical protein